MQKVAIVTDSSSCLTPQLAASRGVEIVPYDLMFEGQVYRDGVDSPSDFYRMLREAKRPPTTAAPSPGLFLEAYQRASRRAESVLCITLPTNLSSSHNSSQQAILLARVELPNVTVVSIPAPAVASGQGLVALDAAEMAARGGSLADVADLVAALSPHIHFYAVLDSLEYLAKGGHVPKVVAWIGDRIRFKPILTARNGKVERLCQVRSKKKAMERMMAMMEQNNPADAPIRALVMHADAPGDAQRFADRIKERFTCDQLLITQFTPVMGAHSGPGVVGVAFRALGSATSRPKIKASPGASS